LAVSKHQGRTIWRDSSSAAALPHALGYVGLRQSCLGTCGNQFPRHSKFISLGVIRCAGGRVRQQFGFQASLVRLQPFQGGFYGLAGRGLGLFHKHMQHQQAALDCGIHGAGDTGITEV
jgi:hypothetical protein